MPARLRRSRPGLAGAGRLLGPNRCRAGKQTPRRDTHSPTIAAALIEHPNIETLLLGGRICKHSAVACGALAVEAASGVSADLFLLGVTGVHPIEGLTTGDAEEAAMKRTLAGRAADTYVLASAEKIGAASAYKVLPLADVAAVITDSPTEDPVIRDIRDIGVRVITTDPAPVGFGRTQ